MKELITRRMALQSLTACACVTCLSAAGLASASEHGAEKAAAGHGGAPHWGYEGEGSPEHWGDLSPDFKTCSLGTEQSPIDLTDAVKAQLGEPFKLEYRAVAGKIVNNGHSIQVNVEPGCSCTIKGKRFDLLQYHFHHPSEHLVDGRPHAMEGHYVHKAEDGQIAVIGVFIKPGAKNAALAPVFASMPNAQGAEQPFETLDPSAAFPASQAYYRYRGSLTTPPCSEGLIWTVFQEPIEASQEQVQAFAKIFPNNARPVKPINRRYLLKSSS